jgi:hypothetical protein
MKTGASNRPAKYVVHMIRRRLFDAERLSREQVNLVIDYLTDAHMIIANDSVRLGP